VIFDDFDVTARGGFKPLEAELRSSPAPEQKASLWSWIKRKLSMRADDGCGRTDDGTFAKGNDCQEDGDGKSEEKSAPSRRKVLTPYEIATTRNPTVKEGKKIVSTEVPGAIISEGLAGKEEIDPHSVGRYLTALTLEARGGKVIDTKSELSDEDFDIMAEGLVAQAQAAIDRGVRHDFYSPEDRKAQLEEYAKIQPLMRGGRTASGFCLGQEDENGNCDPVDGISPQSEFLFRIVQAATSPEANPYENMLRTDQVLSAFFNETDPKKAKLGLNVDLAGAGVKNAKNALAGIQSMIDKIGIDETMALMTGPPMRVGDFHEFLASKIPGDHKKDEFTPGSYAVDEVVPPFSVFGPKIGPFFANNMGQTEFLTADIWFTRTWGRISGNIEELQKPDTAKGHATKALKLSSKISRDELKEAGIKDGRVFRSMLKQMEKTGQVPQAILNWAEKRFKQYSKDGFPSPKKGTGTQTRYDIDRLAVNIVDNVDKLMSTPQTRVMRSNMIKVMNKVSEKMGIPVAYIQDILWQDEQDAWGTVGSRVTTEPGEPSLYSSSIRKMVELGQRRAPRKPPKEKKPRKKSSKRSAGDEDRGADYEYLTDQKGAIEQTIFNEYISQFSPEEYAGLVVEFLKSRGKPKKKSEVRSFIERIAAEVGLSMEEIEKRADDGCGRTENGTFATGNDCQEDGDGSGEEVRLADDYGTSLDVDAKKTKTKLGIPVVERKDKTNINYIDEAERDAVKRGLVTDHEQAKEMQLSTDVDEEMGPYAAFVRSGYVFFTDGKVSIESNSLETIDYNGIEYGTMDEESRLAKVDEVALEAIKTSFSEMSAISKVKFAKEAGLEVPSKMTEYRDFVEQHDEEIFDLYKADEKIKFAAIDDAEQVVGEEADARREAAIPLMRRDLEKALRHSELDCCMQLYRGIRMTKTQARKLLDDGVVVHSGANSWTTSRHTVKEFGGCEVLLVCRNPKVGHVYQADHSDEKEITRPPSEMKIKAAVETKQGWVFYVDEDEDYKDG